MWNAQDSKGHLINKCSETLASGVIDAIRRIERSKFWILDSEMQLASMSFV